MRVVDFWKTVNLLGTEFENLHKRTEKLFGDNKILGSHLELCAAPPQSRRGRSKSGGRLATPKQPNQPRIYDLPMSLRDAIRSTASKLPHFSDTNGHADFESVPSKLTAMSDQQQPDTILGQANADNYKSESSSKSSKGKPHTPRTHTPCQEGGDSIDKQQYTDALCNSGSSDKITPVVHYDLWQIWQEGGCDRSSSFSHRFSDMGISKYGSRSVSQEWRIGDVVRENTCHQALIMRPTAPLRIAWDVTSVFIMGYDIVFIPLMVFSIPQYKFFKIMTYITAIFWTLDVGGSFFVGYHQDGVIEMRPRKIAVKYLKTWFLIDIFVVTFDWYSIFVASSETGLLGLFRINKSLRLARVLRVLRFLRVAKVMSVLQTFRDAIQSEALLVILGILKFVFFILIINHYIACGWYAISEFSPYDEKQTWVGILRRRFDDELTIFFKYTSSLHWSVTQFTPASMEIFPENSLERVYSIVILLSAMVVFSSFISGITAAMTTLRQMNIERTRRTQQVRRFITDKRLSLELGHRIYNFMRNDQQYNSKIRLTESDIEAFKTLPKQLLRDLRTEIFVPRMTPHPFFHQMVHSHENAMVEICSRAVKENILGKHQLLFTRGEIATAMMIVGAGALRYVWGGFANPTDVVKGDFLCEAVLWVRWEHQGNLDTVASCDLVMMDSSVFQNIVAESRFTCYPSCQKYAQHYANHLGQKMQEELQSPSMNSSGRGASPHEKNFRPQVTDIWGDFDIIQEFAQRAFEQETTDSMDTAGARQSFRGFSKLKAMAGRESFIIEPVMRVARLLSKTKYVGS